MLISDVNPSDGERVASSAPDAISFLKADVTSASDWDALFDAAKSRYGRIDILINNAGTTYKNKVHYPRNSPFLCLSKDWMLTDV